MWSKVSSCSAEEISDVRKAHMERLANYRKRKEWQGWVEEDDMDLEGERLLAEIKNYKDESLLNSRFY
jgi:hypothetical protein